MAVTTAGVASLSTLATTEATTVSTVTAESALGAATVTSLGAVAGNVTNLRALGEVSNYLAAHFAGPIYLVALLGSTATT